MSSRPWVTVVLALLSTALGGCATEERVIAARGGLFGLPGSQSALDKDINQSRSAPTDAAGRPVGQWDRLLDSFPSDRPLKGDEEVPSADDGAPVDPAEALRNRLRVIEPDGSVILVSRSPADVMYHLMATLRYEEFELLHDQVLSDQTKTEYRKRGLDPMDAVVWLARRQEQIADLFATFPMGDQTPGVLLENIGRNAFRIRAPVSQRPELKLTTFDTVIEKGSFRLLMIR